MLNQNTRKVLNALTSINTQAIISYPVTGIKMGNNVISYLDLSKLGEEQLEEFGIFNIPEFLSTVSAIGEDSEITMTDGIMDIVNGNSAIRYMTTNIDILEDECRCKLDMLERIRGDKNTPIGSFELPKDEFDKLKKVSGILKDLTDLNVKCNTAGTVELTVQGKEKSSNSISSELSANIVTDETFKIVMANLNKIPLGAYNVEIYKSAKGSLITIFVSQDVDGLEIVIAAK